MSKGVERSDTVPPVPLLNSSPPPPLGGFPDLLAIRFPPFFRIQQGHDTNVFHVAVDPE